MVSDFVFTGYRRRILGAVIKVMQPTWPEYKPDLIDDTMDGVECLVRGYPPLIRFGVVLMLFFVEFGGLITLTGVLPFSMLSQERATRRMESWVDHRFALVRNVPKFLKILICFNIYCRPEIEEFLGAPRRRWRANRQQFREHLIQLDGDAPPPAIPEALGSEPEVPAERYLDFSENDQQGDVQ
jgi:hypothetical protein